MREDSTTRRLGRPANPPVKCVCEYCGNTFEVSAADHRRGRGRFCSRQHAKAATRRAADERFWEKVKRTETCWLWQGATTNHGHGQFRPTKRKIVLAHRFSWELRYGPIPDGLLVCHHCDVPNCVRPDHLFLGTQRDNMEDAANKGRTRNGAETHPERIPHGSDHHNARLTDDLVREIRRRYHAGENARALAAEFGISPVTLRDAAAGRTWKHVA